MSWARYDDELSMNKKVGRLRSKGVDGIAAIGLHLLANTYCRHNGTAGEVEAHVPELLAGKCGGKLARLLAEVGMFDVTESGWAIHDFEEFHDPSDPDPNRSAADRKRELSEKRAEAGRQGGLAKAGKVASKPLANPGNATATDLANGWQTPSPVPDPVPVPFSVDSEITQPLQSVAEAVDNLSPDRIAAIADAYAVIALRLASAKGVQVKFEDRWKAKARRTALAMPDLTRWAVMFPTAPADAVAAWLHGDKGSMRYYQRADEIAAAEDGPEIADVIEMRWA